MYRNFFWKKLREMVDNDRATIFMTCSDEVDVKHADIVGYLRNGIVDCRFILGKPPHVGLVVFNDQFIGTVPSYSRQNHFFKNKGK